MTQPFGFVPPVALPALGGATNVIIPTGGVLAGAAAGAKAGAFFGPKGALAGAALGAIGGLVFLPLPTAPGTLPGLDPGLNPEAQPDEKPAYPSGTLTAGDPSPGAPVKLFNGSHQHCTTARENYRCNEGPGENNWTTPAQCFSPESWQFSGRSVSVVTQAFESGPTCSGFGYTDSFTVRVTGVRDDGTEVIVKEYRARDGTWFNGVGYVGENSTVYAKVLSFVADGEPQPIPDQEPGIAPRPPKPRPTPIPIKPLTPDPVPSPEPGPIPQPEPEPQPDPLNPPQPNDPNRPPVTIPRTPPARPQTPPGRQPGVRPLPFPIQPGIVPAPLPVPGVPTVPEPSPDPNTVPAPGPTPLPTPGPTPVPGTDPEPGETPIPVPPQTPIPTIPATPTTPDTSIPTTPDGSVAPEPTPLPVPTPPNVHYPVPGAPPVTDGGVRADLASIAAEVGRIEQKTAALQNNQKDIPWWLIGPILEALGALLEQDIPGTTYQLQGVCETPDANGNQPVAEFEVEPAKNLGAIINRLDTIDQMLQQHLAWKTPTCKSTITPVGDWRTISFISDEVSPYGSARLRKRFRYRSTSGVGLGGVIDHWKDFVWDAGPVCVQHAGSSWGTPQCWAASVDEGKRVIRHAAGEAGFDPDQDGRWVVSGSDSARIGVPGTMRVNRAGGYYWITARDGSEGRPLVGTVDTDP